MNSSVVRKKRSVSIWNRGTTDTPTTRSYTVGVLCDQLRQYRKILSCFSFLFFLITISCIGSDTLHVISHNRKTVVTDPSKGNNFYKSWAIFPSPAEPVRQVKLKLTLGCPDNMRCADWDYKDHITIRRTGGIRGVSQDYEIGRMLTPYGGAFPKGWQFKWEVDITDFSLLLRDSVEIEYNHTGYEPNNDRGWTITLDFEIVKGKPAWQPISIHKIYDGFFRYGDSANNIENTLKPVEFIPHNQAAFARLRVIQTGHGADRPESCGEFCNKYREVWFDGKLVESKAIWKLCGNNPLYPQAGTWIYNRANWCPGDLMQPDIYDLPVKRGKKHVVDINMQPYVARNPSADESISAYLVEYRNAASGNDISIDDVVRPSLKDIHSRLNPAGMQPQIVVKNMGSSTVTHFKVRYGTRGFEQKIYEWSGSLRPAMITLITLPGIIDHKDGRQAFDVELINPNGKRDQYPEDNKISSWFDPVKRHDSTIVIYLLTNNQPGQNSYVITDSKGKVVKERPVGSLAANTVYLDTLRLLQDHYNFTLSDSAGNGLEFWANARGGWGKARLLNVSGAILKDFESDFGSSVQYSFQVGYPVSPVAAATSFALYPTRTNDKTTFDFYSNDSTDLVVQIVTDPGDKIVEEHKYTGIRNGNFTYDLSRFPRGRFYLRVLSNGEEKFKKRIRLKE